MRAAVLRQLGQPLTIEALRLPALGRGHVLVRMQLAAVCHSQQLEVSGAREADLYLPHLIGHEGVGIVEELGDGVTKVRQGDQVVLSWIRGSGLAGAPIQYVSAHGPVNAGPIATFCEMPVVSEQCVIRIDPPVDPEVAVLAGCALPTGVGTVWNAMAAPEGGAVCVIGLGGVGLSAVAGAVYAGWSHITAVDLRARRLKQAMALGATQVIDATHERLDEVAATLPGGGFDLVLECAGAKDSMETAVRVAKPKGGRVILVGNLTAGQTIEVDPFDLIKGRWVGGSWGGNIEPETDIPRLVRLVEEGRINKDLLIGRRFLFDQVNEAIEALGDEDPGRPILEVALGISAHDE